MPHLPHHPGLGAVVMLLCVGSCKASPAAPTAPGHESPVSEPAAPPPEPSAETSVEQGAFVILGDQGTLVLPLDPEREVLDLVGHWVGGLPADSGRAWGRRTVEVKGAGEDEPAVPVCPAGDFGDPCELDVDLDGSDRRIAVESSLTELTMRVHMVPGDPPRWTLFDADDDDDECACVVVPGISTDGEPEPDFDLSDPATLDDIALSPYEPEEYEEHCGEEALRPSLTPTSVLGGRLYENGEFHNGICSGLNLYDGASRSIALRPDAVTPTAEFPLPSCPDDPFDLAELEPYSGPPAEDDWVLDELTAYGIERGWLLWGSGSITDLGDERYCISGLPLAPELCPSDLDPCGTLGGNEYLEDLVVDRFWVSTDGRWALVTDDSGVALYAAGRDEPTRRVPRPDSILGVEFHSRSGLLAAPDVPDMLRPSIPPLHPDDAEYSGRAGAWGNRCFAHLKAGRLDAAEAACFAGLLEGGSDRTRGAITYNLGRIEEARAQPQRALQYYRRSNLLRPGNTTVRRRIEALSAS